MKRIIASFLCAAVLVVSFCSCSKKILPTGISVKSAGLSDTVALPEFSDEVKAFAPEEYDVVADNSSLSLFANLTTGDFALYDKAHAVYHYSGKWEVLDPENPISELNFGRIKTDLVSLISINYVQLSTIAGTAVPFYMNSYAYCIMNNKVTVDTIKDGYRATFFFSDIEAYISVEIVLKEDGISARIVGSEIKTGNDYLITSISLLPGFMAGYEKNDGYCFVPSGSGALIPLDSGRGDTTEYKEPVYGEDTALAVDEYKGPAKNIYVPVYGIKENDYAITAIISEGDVYADIQANANGLTTCYTRVYSTYTTSSIESTTLFESNFENQRIIYGAEQRSEFTDYTVDYHFNYGNKANYAWMAECYRDYLNLKANPEAPKLAITLYGAAYKKANFAGVPYSDDFALTSFDDVSKIVSEFESGTVALNMSGFNGTGVDTEEITPSFSPASVVGSKNDFKKLVGDLKDKKTEAYYDLNFLTFKSTGNGYSVYSDVCRSIFNTRTPIYKYMRSTYVPVNNENPSYLTVPEMVYSASANFLKSYDYSCGLSYSGLGEMLYSDFKSGGNRRVTVEIFKKLLSEASDKKGIALEGANAYTYPYISRIFSMPVTSDGNVLFSRDIPFLQMVLHGSIAYSAEYDGSVLDSIAFGADPSFYGVMYNDSELFETTFNWLYGSTYTNWLEKAKAAYKQYSSVYSGLYSEKFVDYEESDGVSVSTFSDGTKVYVNRGSSEATVDGVTVGANNYKVIGRG